MKTMMFICCTVLHIFSNWYWRILSQWKINFRHIETHFSLVLSSSLSLFINHSLMYKIDRITQRRIICVKNLFFQKCDATRKCFNQIPFKRHVHHVCSPFRTKYLENDTNSQIDFITYGRSARISMRKWKNMRPKIFHVIHKNRKALYNTSHSIGHTLFSSITKKKKQKQNHTKICSTCGFTASMLFPSSSASLYQSKSITVSVFFFVFLHLWEQYEKKMCHMHLLT